MIGFIGGASILIMTKINFLFVGIDNGFALPPHLLIVT